MTLPMSESPPTTSLARTLPKPKSSLSHEALTAYTRRSSSLLQHHIGSSQFLTPAVEESERNHHLETVRGVQLGNNGSETTIQTSRRASSVMSSRDPSKSPSFSSSGKPEVRKGYCLCQPEPKIPRPRNAFILYRQHQHSDVVARNPGLPNPDISKIIGEQWRQLSPEDKDEWKALAEEEKIRHSQQFPDYRYRPKRQGRYAIPSSSESTPTSNTSTGSCLKCGGKTMNPPHTNHFPPFTPVTHAMPPIMTVQRSAKRPYTEIYAQQPPPTPSSAQAQNIIAAMLPSQTPATHYRPVQQQHLVQYATPMQYAVTTGLPPSSAAHTDGHETKRRRYDDGTPNINRRHNYRDPEHDYNTREATYLYHDQTTIRSPESNMASLRRTPYMPPPSTRHEPVRKPTFQQLNQDSTLVLPPLKITNAQHPKPIVSSSVSSQKSGIEAMIMSYPVITKLKTLSTITPTLASTKSAGDSGKISGAIVAVEGMDSVSVRCMTSSLVEQLEKGGKFAVKVFNGPNPYEAFESSSRASIDGNGELMTTEKYLNMIQEWHQMSKEMIDFVTQKESSETVGSQQIMDPNHPQTYKASEAAMGPLIHEKTKTEILKSPISAISPRTINQTAGLSIRAPRCPDSPKSDVDEDIKATPQQLPRVPLAALEAKKKAQKQQGQEGTSSLQNAETSLCRPEGNSTSTAQEAAASNKIPIALVPHYQLTTVDTCSIALPITDKYDPVTHWRWHATLWRGCIGPDVTVVIKSPHEQFEEETSISATSEARNQAPRAGNPSQSQSQQALPFGVEVRLQDCRAVIVNGGDVPSRDSGRSNENAFEDNESWEKAKRRVGFEVEEFLRK